jgi:hypothetical protein
MKRVLMTMGKAAAITAVVGMVFAGSALAQIHHGQEGSMVALHAQAHNTKGIQCGGINLDMPCDQFVNTWPLGSGADVYMMIAEADSALGVSGVSLGVLYSDYDTITDGIGVDVFGYTFCSDLQYTNSPSGTAVDEFPYSGGGNRLIWVRTTNCQRHVVPPYQVQAVACVFYCYAYSPDNFIVDMNRNLQTPDEFQIVDCPGPALSDMPWPSHAGVLAFGGTGAEYNPCTDIPTPTENTTWGKLKNQYN